MPIGISKLNLISQNKEFYLAVAHATSPRITVYSQDDTSLTKISDPDTLPTGDGWAAEWSPDGVYLAVGHATSPFLTIYKRSGSTMTKLTNPANLPTDIVLGLSFSGDGVYLAVVSNTTTNGLRVYKRSGDTYTSIYNTNLASIGRAASFDRSATYLLVTHRGTTDKISVYKRTDDSFSKLTNPPSYPSTQVGWGSFSNDGVYLAVGSDGTPYANLWKRSDDSFTKLTSPTVNSSIVRSMIFDPSAHYLCVCQQVTPFLSFYRRQGDEYYQLASPSQPAGEGQGQMSWSNDSRYYAMGHATTPFVSIYRRDGDTLTKLSNPATLPASTGRGLCFSPLSRSTSGSYFRPFTGRFLGNAQISTAQSKFGSSSALFDGTGDAIRFVGESLNLGSADFTIEFWVRVSSLAAQRNLFDQRNANSNQLAPVLFVKTTGIVTYLVNGVETITSTTSLQINTWYHIAVSKQSTSTRLYINGQQEGSTYTDTNTYLNQPVGIGGTVATNAAVSNSLSGYIDELRISNTARYTSGFTPSTQAFTNDANTLLLCHFEGTNASTTTSDDQG